MKTLLIVLALAGPDYPKQTGIVNDFAGILDPGAKTKLEGSLQGLQRAKNFVLVLVTVKSLEGQAIEQYTVGLANAWKIGEKGKNNGIVFLVAPAEKGVRIENGYGAEGTLTDIESKFLMEEKVIPLFKEGKLAAGIEAGTNALIAKLGGGIQEAARPPPPQLSAGTITLIVVIVIIVIILMCFPGGRDFLCLIIDIAASSSGGSSSSGGKSSKSSSDSSSGGGSFGGGGASSKW